MEDKKKRLVNTIFETKRDDHLADTIWYQYIPLMQKHSQYGTPKMSDNGRRLKDMEKETMGDENMEQRKFKVGDKIRVADRTTHMNGKTGEIKYYDGSSWRPYQVQIYGESELLWLESDEMELVEEAKEMTGFEVLLKHWGLKVGEKFNIEGDNYNPYYFNESGNMFDCDDDKRDSYNVWKIVTGRSKIEKIKVKEMTIADIEKELGYAIKVVKEEK